MKSLLLYTGILLPIFSSAIYIRGIVRGKVRPQRMTRLLLLFICAISWASLVAAHDRVGVWLAFISCVQAVAIWLLSLRWGIGGRDPLDLWCLLLCAVGVALWLLSRESLFGLVMSIVADLLACLPSLRKTWRQPHTESAAFYLLDVIAAGCIAAAAPLAWRPQLYPLYILLVNAVFAYVILRPRYKAASAARQAAAAENPTDLPPQ